MKFIYSLIFILISMLFVACGGSSSGSKSNDLSGETKYKITVTGLWSNSDFPTNYPSSAHFSAIVGMTHDSSIKLFDTGSKASSGVISVAQTGKTGTISSEISQFIKNGDAEFEINGGAISTGTGEAVFDISVNSTHPYLSFVSMIAPSPDWFIGLNSLNLLENGQWVNSKEVKLVLYDSGSDSGVTFTSANSDTNPKEDITKLTSNASDTDFSDGVHRNDATKYIAKINIIKVN